MSRVFLNKFLLSALEGFHLNSKCSLEYFTGKLGAKMGIALNICLTRAVLIKYVDCEPLSLMQQEGRRKASRRGRQTHDLKVGMLDQ